MSNQKSGLKKITSMRLFMPIVCLLVIIIVATITILGIFDNIDSRTAYLTGIRWM